MVAYIVEGIQLTKRCKMRIRHLFGSLSLVLGLSMVGCVIGDPLDTGRTAADADGDGYTELEDCNDLNAAVHPGAIEIPGNGIDDNCDGQVDEENPTDVIDFDGDGYVDTNAAGEVVDCNDDDPAVHPGATEVENGIDDDCDGEVDEGSAAPTETPTPDNDMDDDGVLDDVDNCEAVPNPTQADADDDGIGDACDQFTDADGDEYSVQEDDCDDTDANVNPGATEVENGVDDDCDGLVDEGFGESEEQTLTITVTYPRAHDALTLNVQPVWHEGELGDWWLYTKTVYGKNTITITVTDEFDILGLRFNVTVADDGVAYDWYSYGHCGGATLDEDVFVDIEIDDESWDEDDVDTWSPGDLDDVSLGSSALLWFPSTYPEECQP